MNIGAYDFDSLRKLVRNLQAENRKLRALLNKAAIPYSESEVFSDALSAAEYDLDQGARISQQYIGTNLATRFFSMFWAGKMYLQKELKMGITGTGACLTAIFFRQNRLPLEYALKHFGNSRYTFRHPLGSIKKIHD
ncbi:hypothetical protein ADH76_25225 [Enterocloster clostridioformis]|uniref:hypothetical protein n=1 Tax=Enterocloster clostridioformis TaxID=1531 RepID=UPI00080C50B9|nr:hypothetical protein [Enterocloster clostridioformis]ANU49424.1 hypothetical protein A4V08_29960 [Lachnoclostridium sp. YL32]OXE64241.1 hypothetical protein ADH76_25225 [Enterocloster clostridioformis]